MQMQMQRIVQACENEVLGIIHRAFFDANYEVRAKVFDGLVVEPRAGAPSVKSAMAAAEEACLKRGWEVSLVEKPLHGLQDQPLKTITEARQTVSLMPRRGLSA